MPNEIEFAEDAPDQGAIDFLPDEKVAQFAITAPQEVANTVMRTLTNPAVVESAQEGRDYAQRERAAEKILTRPMGGGVMDMPYVGPETAGQLRSAAGAVGRAIEAPLAGMARAATQIVNPVTFLPEEQQAPLRPFVINERDRAPGQPAELRHMTRGEAEARAPFQPGVPLIPVRGTELQPEGSDMERLLSQNSTPGNIAMIAAGGVSKVIGSALLASMIPGVVDDIAEVAGGSGSMDQKRERINQLILPALLALRHGGGFKPEQAIRDLPPPIRRGIQPVPDARGRFVTPEGERRILAPEIIDQPAVPGPLELTGAELPGRPKGFTPAVPTAGPVELGPAAPPRVRRPEVPEVGEAQQRQSMLEEIRANDARTRAQIREIFPDLSNEQAAELRNAVWGKPNADMGVTVSPTIPRPEPMSPIKPTVKAPEAAPDEFEAQQEARRAEEARQAAIDRSNLEQGIITQQRLLEDALAKGDVRGQEDATRKLMALRKAYEGVPEPVKGPIKPKPPIPGLPRGTFKPEVPGTPAEPREPIVQEIQRRNLRTRQQVLDAFPSLLEGGQSREKAADLLRKAWGTPQPPEGMGPYGQVNKPGQGGPKIPEAKTGEEPPPEEAGPAVTAPKPKPPPADAGGARTLPDYDPEDLGMRERIKRKMDAGMSRDDAVAEIAKESGAVESEIDKLPPGTRVRNKSGQLYENMALEGQRPDWVQVDESTGDIQKGSVTTSQNLRGGKVERLGTEKPKGATPDEATAPKSLEETSLSDFNKNLDKFLDDQGLPRNSWPTDLREKVFSLLKEDAIKNRDELNTLLEQVEGAEALQEMGLMPKPTPLPESARARLQKKVARMPKEKLDSPHDLEPALMVEGEPVSGGEDHNDIYNSIISEEGASDARIGEAFDALKDDARHVFVDKEGRIYSREQAAKALGETEPLQSRRLRELQKNTPKPGAKPAEPTAPEGIEGTVIAGKTLAEWEKVTNTSQLPKGDARAELAKWLAVPNLPLKIVDALKNKKRTREIHAPPATEVKPVTSEARASGDTAQIRKEYQQTVDQMIQAETEFDDLRRQKKPSKAKVEELQKKISELKARRAELRDAALPTTEEVKTLIGDDRDLNKWASNLLEEDPKAWTPNDFDHFLLVEDYVRRKAAGDMEPGWDRLSFWTEKTPKGATVVIESAPFMRFGGRGSTSIHLHGKAISDTGFYSNIPQVREDMTLREYVKDLIARREAEETAAAEKAARKGGRKKVEAPRQVSTTAAPKITAPKVAAAPTTPVKAPVSSAKPTPTSAQPPEAAAEHPIDALLAKEFGVKRKGTLSEDGKTYTTPPITKKQYDELYQRVEDTNLGWTVEGFDRAGNKVVGSFVKRSTPTERKIAELKRSLGLTDFMVEEKQITAEQGKARKAEIQAKIDELEKKGGTKIVAAAVRLGKNQEQDVTHALAAAKLFDKLGIKEGDPRVADIKEGFIDDKGNWVEPDEAFDLARAAGQVAEEGEKELGLHSGDLKLKGKPAPKATPSRKKAIAEGLAENERIKTNPQPGDVIKHPDFGDVRVTEVTPDRVSFDLLTGSRKAASLSLKEWREDLTGKLEEQPAGGPDPRRAALTEAGLDAFDLDRLARITGMSQDQWLDQTTIEKNHDAAIYAADKPRLLAMEEAIESQNVAKVKALYNASFPPDHFVRRLFEALTKTKHPQDWAESLIKPVEKAEPGEMPDWAKKQKFKPLDIAVEELGWDNIPTIAASLEEVKGYYDAYLEGIKRLQTGNLNARAKEQVLKQMAVDLGQADAMVDEFEASYGPEATDAIFSADEFRDLTKHNPVPIAKKATAPRIVKKPAEPTKEWENKVGLKRPIRPAPSEQLMLPLPVDVQGEVYTFTPEEVKKANLACRVCGAVGAGAITPKYVQATSSRTETILDFGSGDQAPHTKTLKGDGFNVTAYEFGQNVVEGVHDTKALERKYDTVFASNVLNVQSGRPMLRATLKEIFDSTAGRAVFNYPRKPRYSELSTVDVANEIEDIFGVPPTRVGGTPDAPIWEVRRDGKTPTAPKSSKDISMGPGAASPGEFTEARPSSVGIDPGNDAWNRAIRHFDNFLSGIKQLFTRSGFKQDFSQLANAADNIPRMVGQQAGNAIRLRTDGPDRRAITFLMQALKMSGDGIDVDDAARMGKLEFEGNPRGYLETKKTDMETKAQEFLNQGQKIEAQAALDAAHYMGIALQRYATLMPTARLAKRMFDAQWAREQKAGIPVDYERWYVPQRHELELFVSDNKPIVLGHSKGTGTASGFRKAKVYEDYATAIENGFAPRNLDIADLLENRVFQGERLIQRKALFDQMRRVTDPVDGKAIATRVPRRVITRQDGTVDVQETVPLGYEMYEPMPGMRLAIHQGYARLIKALTGTSQIAESAVVGTLSDIAAIEKHLTLAIDTFHASRTLQAELALTGKLSVGEHQRRGLALVEYRPQDLNLAVEKGLITQEMADWVRKPQPMQIGGQTVKLSPHALLVLGAKNGLNMARVSDVLYRDWIRELPVIGDVQKWVFDKATRSAISQSFLHEFERVAQANPHLNATQVARKVASDINVFFGNLGKESIFKNPSLRTINNILFLAPQWVEALARREYRAVAQAGGTIADAFRGKPIRIGTASKGIGTGLAAYFVATQLLNLWTRGHLTFQNPEEGHKLDAYIPPIPGLEPGGKKGRGGFISPLSVFGEITHNLLYYFHQKPDMASALSQIGENKFGNIARFLQVMGTGRDPLTGEKLVGTGRRALTAAVQMVPVPIIASQTLKRGAAEVVPGSVQPPPPGASQRQIFASLGFKTEPAPTATMQTRRMVDAWKGSSNNPAMRAQIERRLKEDFGPSDYRDLRTSLARDDLKAAERAYQILLETKKPDDIRNTMAHPHPFTGSRKMEALFLHQLTPEQTAIYRDAIKERSDLNRKFQDMLRDYYRRKHQPE